jgi:hypothetical protein
MSVVSLFDPSRWVSRWLVVGGELFLRTEGKDAPDFRLALPPELDSLTPELWWEHEARRLIGQSRAEANWKAIAVWLAENEDCAGNLAIQCRADRS